MSGIRIKAGDEVICIEGGSGGAGWELDRVFTVESVNKEVAWPTDETPYMTGRGVYLNSLKLNKKSMTLKDKFALAFKGEPEKSFIKAGVMNSDESLTSDGKELFMAYLLKKNGDDFKTTVVDPILAEEEVK